jgi:hypothetical protein
MVAYSDLNKIINLVFSMPTVPLYPSLSLYPNNNYRLKFNGTTTFVTATGSASLACITKAGTYSFEALLYTTGDPGSSQQACVFEKSSGASDRNGMIHRSTYISFGYYNGSTWVGKSKQTSLNTLYHVIGTNNGGTLALYVDGVAQSGTTPPYVSIGTNFRLGKTSLAGSGATYKGDMDNVRVYNRVLTPTEAAEHYNNIFTDETGLVLKYTMDEGTGSVLNDSTANVNTGTITDGDWALINLYPGDDALPLPGLMANYEVDKLINIISAITHSDTKTNSEVNKLIAIISAITESDLSHFTESDLINILSGVSGSDTQAKSDANTLIALISTVSEADNHTNSEVEKLVDIISDFYHYEAAYLSDVYIYVVPIPTITVSETDYLNGADQHLIDIISTISQSDNINLTESDLIDMIFSPTVNRSVTNNELGKLIPSILTPIDADIAEFIDDHTVNIVCSVANYVHVPYRIHTTATILKPKGSATVMNKPKIMVYNVSKPKMQVRNL